ELYKIYDIGEDSGGWKLEWAIRDIKNIIFENSIYKVNYRPFDFKYTCYTGKNCGFMARPVYDIFEHFLENENIGLMIGRQFSAIGSDIFDIVFCTDKITDLNFYRRGGEQIFPLYLYPTTRSKKFLKKENPNFNEENFTSKIENFKESFRTFIDEFYKEKF
ncbi:DNA methyltransferase, partial [Campylobacter jejuni]|nr:DNA methyltransferase [Campylobacter jejuni]